MQCSLSGVVASDETLDNPDQQALNICGLEANLSVGKPHRRQPGSGVDLIPAPISRLLKRRAVVTQPVRFDHEPELVPEEIHSEPIDHYACLRDRQARAAHQPQEPALELRVREPERAPIEEAAESRDAGLASHSLELSTQAFGIYPVVFIGLVQGGLDCGLGKSGSQVHQSAHGIGQRNSVSNHLVCFGKRSAAMQADPREFPLDGRRN
jgi:hypothetical protein